MRARTWAVLSMLLVGCGGQEPTGSSSSGGDGGGGGGGGNASDPLAAPEHGVQIASEPIEVKPGEEKYSCWSFNLPEGAEFPLIGIESQIESPSVHHYGIFTDANAGAGGDEAYECETMGTTWGLVTGGGVGTPP